MSTPSVRRSIALVSLFVSLGLAACGGGDDGGGTSTGDDGGGSDAAATVALKPTTFEPEDVTVKVGETVLWKWAGGVQHDVDGDGFKSELQSKGEFEHTYYEAGTFDYHCNVHPTTMKGTVTVEA